MIKYIGMKNEIIKVIKDVAAKQNININLTEAALDQPFKDMGVDSINVLGIIVAIEEKVGFRLDDSVLSNIKTINQLIKAFEAKKK